ncbi:MAG: SDR family NAD(P)-dependent oxidoreductase [Gemmatimonadota bacterium]|nr:SDR family NAD(P)-dependent oxidoreductase [Gemmatimonadota bacterium]MDH3366391.1 SDR family NAD(P)-dependent oxidoreductase [Gemmatimonadota bacterium]MDH3477577.1 SDR family NAD(P)-dependent oxidoreductase [Gemmatimonadota bacterium]MDH3568614.1 SDR family NAD(P)-dependent oxidoreductase [Gemmatimonadota bacterium]MDH5548668.1 SDR family NAD(P)-dependent oxidoreductase [Gemmatimonadota bacterium]
MDLDNAICVVTGATEGIGRAIAESLANRGARLALCARTGAKVTTILQQLTEEAGFTVVGQACDVADEADVTRFAAFVRDSLGPVDVLVNNAGLGHRGPVVEMSTAAFDETFAVNVRGTFLMTRAFLPEMLARGRGHVVNIASLAGRNPVPNAAAYSAAKHAVLGFSKSLFAEVRHRGVRVTAICPGSVATPFFEKSGMGLEHPDRKLQPEDVATTVIAALDLPDRALVSELDVRPTNP